MKTIKATPITYEEFAPFGQFYNIESPCGYALCAELHNFHPDRINTDSTHGMGFSPITAKKPEGKQFEIVL